MWLREAAKQSKAKQSKAKQSKAKQSKAKQSKAKQNFGVTELIAKDMHPTLSSQHRADSRPVRMHNSHICQSALHQIIVGMEAVKWVFQNLKVT